MQKLEGIRIERVWDCFGLAMEGTALMNQLL